MTGSNAESHTLTSTTRRDAIQGKSRRRKKMLTAEQKYELWLSMVRGEGTQRELADRWGVDRSTVTRAAEIAKHGAMSALEASKPGKPGGTTDPRAEELRDAEAEIEQLTEVIKEQAIELAMLRGKQRGAW
jgi:transposase